ncbi:MAG: hypothetical protein ACI936_002043 [Paraglaciecola sp.]|jgi:hypothetical protein
MSNNLKENQAFLTLISIFNLKKVKDGVGHDRNGLYCDLCLKSKVLLSYGDDGYGGETDHDFTSEVNKKYLDKFIADNNLNQVLFDNGYNFYGSVNEVRNDTVIDEIIGTLYHLKQIEKQNKILAKHCEKSIVVGVDAFNYSYYGFKNIKSLLELVSKKGGPLMLLKTYEKAVEGLSENEKILNTQEQLINLGVIKATK